MKIFNNKIYRNLTWKKWARPYIRSINQEMKMRNQWYFVF